MGEVSFSTRLDTGGSDEKMSLMDDIDKLRSLGIDHYVPLPQLVVCGDQSSGKSSVLEAISGIPFPAKDGLCTRFATEVILRRGSQSSISVAIVPSRSRLEAERQTLAAFHYTLSGQGNFYDLVEKAKEAMGISNSASAFSNDILRLEISGPSHPHLTIVDLPGLIHSENKVQSRSDVVSIQDVVRRYMQNTRSIILAVVSAKNDYANQVVLKLAREVDPLGKRTLGVVTKPDTLAVGSESERAFVGLVKNVDIEFRLGWHTLKNRSYETRKSTPEERDAMEEAFFNQGVWKELPRAFVGISTLRCRLSNLLFDQITSELGALVDDIESGINECRSTLARLGVSRGDLDKQRQFLFQISQNYQSLLRAALEGSYADPFFGDPRTNNGYSKRLQAVVQNQNLAFAENMRTKGQSRQIVDHLSSGQTQTPCESKGGGGAQRITRHAFINEIRVLLKRTRGCELPGMYNPAIVGELFYEQSKPWNDFAQQHILDIFSAITRFLKLLLGSLADQSVADMLLQYMVTPYLALRRSEVNSKLEELLKPFKRESGHPITYNHYFTETIQNIRSKRNKEQTLQRIRKAFGYKEQMELPEHLNIKNTSTTNLVDVMGSVNEADMDQYACMEILDCMEAYYKVAMKLFVDNICIYAVDQLLLARLADVLSASSILQMDATMVGKIAAEPLPGKLLREETQKKLDALVSGLETCRAHIGSKGE